MKKAELRKIFKEKRNELTEGQVSAMDLLIFEELTSYDWSNITYLHCYLAIAKFKEFDTMPFIEWIWKNHPSIQIVISKSDFKTHLLQHYILDKDTILTHNSWGIPEPEGSIEVNPKDIDAVLAPLLIFDENGNRVGYGKGFYDRFFASCKPTVLRTGISYFEPIAQIEDINEWDVPISVVFTPMKTYFL